MLIASVATFENRKCKSLLRRAIITSRTWSHTEMPEINQGYNIPGASSQGDDTDISPEVVEKLLRQVPDGPLKHVEDVVFPEPWPPFPIRIRRKHTKSRRGPKSIKDWTNEVRRVWGYLEDERKLSESWLALLPPVQKLAASSYGGRTIGSGLALQEFLNKALIEAQQYDMENQTREILKNFPRLTITEIASQLKLDRAHVSRRYCTRATNLLTKAFQRIIDRSN